MKSWTAAAMGRTLSIIIALFYPARKQVEGWLIEPFISVSSSPSSLLSSSPPAAVATRDRQPLRPLLPVLPPPPQPQPTQTHDEGRRLFSMSISFPDHDALPLQHRKSTTTGTITRTFLPMVGWVGRHRNGKGRRYYSSCCGGGTAFSTTALFVTSAAASMQSCLAIIPPDEAWDQLQRARHMARDQSYTKWPPAIRLFHPFCSPTETHDMAMRVASVVERYQIEPFEIRFNQWSIIPHAEAMEADWEALRNLPDADSGDPSESDRGGGVMDDDTENDDRVDHYDHDTNDDQMKYITSMQRRKKKRRINANNNGHPNLDDPAMAFLSPEERKVHALIAREERIGREKLLERQRRNQLATMTPANTNGTTIPPSPPAATSTTARVLSSTNTGPAATTITTSNTKFQLLRKQKQMYEEFNGPAVVCLEPDSESQRKLRMLRSMLLTGFTNEEANLYEKYSPTSSVSNTGRLPKASMSSSSSSSSSSLRDRADSYRPVLPIAAFPTVSAAIETARRLRSDWEPLVFPVTDLHLLSSSSPYPPEDASVYNDYRHHYEDIDHELDNREYRLFSQQSRPGPNRPRKQGTDEELHLTTVGQWGCDALVMLMGQEIEMDHAWNEEMAQMVFRNGTKGGYELRGQSPPPTLSVPDDVAEDLQQWLLEDDEFDEGTVVVIGRTHFFTGEMRNYVGMPAFSVMDGKDRVMGDSVSGAARRRGSTNRASEKTNDGTREPRKRRKKPIQSDDT